MKKWVGLLWMGICVCSLSITVFGANETRDYILAENLSYNGIGSFQDGWTTAHLNGKYGFIGVDGAEIIPLQYESAKVLENGRGLVQKDGLYGIIDQDGVERIPCVYSELYVRHNGFVVVEQDGKMGVYNDEYTQIAPCIYDEIREVNGTFAEVVQEGLHGVLNQQGEVVVPLQYEDIDINILSTGDGCFFVEENGKWGLIGEDGTVLVAPKYDEREAFREDLAGVSLDGRCGFINPMGKEVIPLQYDVCADGFSEGLAAVRLEQKWGYIDSMGEVLIPLEYYHWTEDFSDGIVKMRGKNGTFTLLQQPEVLQNVQMSGFAKEEVAFLTAEQMQLVEDGFAYMEAMTMSIGWLPERVLDGSGGNAWMSDDFVEINDWGYLPYVDGFYTDWDVFYDEFTSVLTPEYFDELNTNFDNGVEYRYYENVDGMLYYMPADRGSHILYMGNDWLRYELVEANDDEITCNLIAYYCDFEDLENGDGKVARTMERHPVVLQNTEEGWRIAEFDLPY